MAPKKTVKKTITTRKNNPKSKSPAQNKAKTELISILDGLSQDEINWLITQANIMVYNHKIEDVNKAAQTLNDSKKQLKPSKKPSVKTVDIVQAGGAKNFNILLGNARLFLNLNELKSLVKIAAAVDNPKDGAGRLFRWFSKERNDILIDGGITGPGDNKLRLIYLILKEKFTVG